MRIVLMTGLVILCLGLALTFYSKWRVRQWEAQNPPAGSTAQVGHVSLHYIEEGEGQPVVFLHGGILASVDFQGVVRLAGQQGYHAIAFDRPGYGHSERPRGQVTPVVQARLLHQALKAMNVEKPIVVAHSYSGSVAMAYALQYPGDVGGIVLVSAAIYGGEMYPAGYGDPLSRLVTTPVVGSVFLNTFLVPLASLVMPHMVEQTFAPDPAPQEYIRTALALWSRPSQFKANREDILYFSPTMDSLEQRFEEINVPVVFVYGERDPFGVDQHAKKLSRTLPHVQTIVVPGAGHMLPVVYPKAIVDALSLIAKSPAKSHTGR